MLKCRNCENPNLSEVEFNIPELTGKFCMSCNVKRVFAWKDRKKKCCKRCGSFRLVIIRFWKHKLENK